MEVMNQHVADAEAVVVPPLNGSHENGENSIMNGTTEKRSANSIYFEENEGMWKCKDCNWTYKFGNPLVDHVHVHNSTFKGKSITVVDDDDPNLENLKNKILSGLNASASTSTSQQDQVAAIMDLSQVIDLDDDDEIELEFERAIDKAHTHTPYCPNCSRQITKVILRRKKRQHTPPSHKSFDLLGCLSCFSIFIPSGDCLNPFRIFKTKWAQQGENITPVPPEPHAGPAVVIAPALLLGTQGNQVPDAGETKNKVTSPNAPTKDSRFHIITSALLLGPRRQPAAEKQDPKSTEQTPFEDTGDALIRVPQSRETPFEDIGDALLHVPKSQKTPVEEIGDALLHVPESQDITQPLVPAPAGGDVAIDVPEEPAIRNPQVSVLPQILKCIVYGGLMELIASMSVVSSAAASDATTLNIICIGLATLISSLFIFGHHLLDLKNYTSQENSDQQVDRYQELLGRRGHFLLHSSLATLSFILFGLLPPVVYGFAFRKSDNKDYKILAVAATSFICVLILATTRAYVNRNRTLSDYIKTVLYYMTMAVSASGIAYAAGHVVNLLMQRLGWFEPNTPKVSVFAPVMVSHSQAWGAY